MALKAFMMVMEGCSFVFKIAQKIPVFGRIVDVSTGGVVFLLRCGSGTFVASGSEKCKRPEKLLKLYEYEGCPYCRKVREALCVLDLDVMILPCPRETLKASGVSGKSRFRPEVQKLGGDLRFPFLVDENTGKSMNESDKIVAYLWETYGAAATPPLSYRLGQKLERTPLMMLPSLFRPLTTHGVLRVPSKLPKAPLVLWGFESSPFVRLVRETLSSLELPYIQRNVAHGSDAKRLEFRQKYGSQLSTLRAASSATTVQMPLLIDPNTGVEMLESADIVSYLWKTYQDGPVSSESWSDLNYGKPPVKNE